MFELDVCRHRLDHWAARACIRRLGYIAVVTCAIAAPDTVLAAITHIPAFTVYGGSSVDNFGFSVSVAGDVNGDNVADILAGAPNDIARGSNSGSARVLSGVDGSEIYAFYGENPHDYFGVSVSAATDLSGDGISDFIVGAYLVDSNGRNSGTVYVYSGADGVELYRLIGQGMDHSFGRSVSALGDLNGDGLTDFAVGAPHDNDKGSIQVFSGADGTEIFKVYGNSTADQFGWSVGDAGDINGDHIPDLIVGDYLSDVNGTDSGSAHVLSGADGSELYTFYGNNSGDGFGFSVNGAGDVNNDGFSDLIIGARFDDTGAPNGGSARVLSGATGQVLFEFFGASADADMGYSVDGAGDVNSDGKDDLIVGVKKDNMFGAQSGSVRIYSGADGTELFIIPGEYGSNLGVSVTGGEDINRDGIPDFVVGANRGSYVQAFVSIPEPASAISMIICGLTLCGRSSFRNYSFCRRITQED